MQSTKEWWDRGGGIGGNEPFRWGRGTLRGGPTSSPGQFHRRTAEDSDASGVPLETDLDLAALHDDRHAALVA